MRISWYALFLLLGINVWGQEQEIEPIYDEIPGWQCDLTAFDREEQLPKAFLDYVAYLERELEVPIAILSVGPDRKQTIVRG